MLTPQKLDSQTCEEATLCEDEGVEELLISVPHKSAWQGSYKASLLLMVGICAAVGVVSLMPHRAASAPEQAAGVIQLAAVEHCTWEGKGSSTCCHLDTSDNSVHAKHKAEVHYHLTSQACQDKCESEPLCQAFEYESRSEEEAKSLWSPDGKGYTNRCEIHKHAITDFTCVDWVIKPNFECFVKTDCCHNEEVTLADECSEMIACQVDGHETCDCSQECRSKMELFVTKCDYDSIPAAQKEVFKKAHDNCQAP